MLVWWYACRPSDGIPCLALDGEPMKHVVLYSGGLSSHFAAKRVIEQHGRENTILLFTDTLTEDPDLYRFLDQASQSLGVTITRLCDGRNIWQVFKDRNFLGNNRVDPCSEELKRWKSGAYIRQFKPDEVTIYLGFGWDEGHRYEKAQRYWLPYKVEAPLQSPPYLSNQDMIEFLREGGIEPPRLYELGFAHNNCGGGCVKAGIGHFKHLLNTLPEVFDEWERNEEAVRQHIGKDVAMLTRTINGKKIPYPLSKLRKASDLTKNELIDVGGCGCFTPSEDVNMMNFIFGDFFKQETLDAKAK